MGANTKQASGFTLVEISIVMIIIGLLIGGTFGGMKLVENMQVNKTVQDLKAIESAALTFKDTYGRLPGDMPNTAARLPSCTDAPCATGGNGDRAIDRSAIWNTAIVATDERFTFWHHLAAASLLSMDYKNTTTTDYGEGQPQAPIGVGYRLVTQNAADVCHNYAGSHILLGVPSSGVIAAPEGGISCRTYSSIDTKTDDGLPKTGKYTALSCAPAGPCTDLYMTNSNASAWFDLAF